ncbi:MAG: redoxin domain-containing protein, partial [Bacteroidales bacterium]|nr:redoxin domain-containing protein [Bacteroidales bacterium]
EAYRDFTKSFIEEYPGSFAALISLYQYVSPQEPVLDIGRDFNWFKMVDEALSIKYPTSEPVVELNKTVALVKEQNQLLTIGKTAPEIALPDTGGHTILLSSVKGEYVLVDFWASWCEECKQNNERLMPLYKRYKELGLNVYQVSLDKSKTSWEQYLRQDSIPWVQVSDLKFWGSPVVNAYNIKAIPANFLMKGNRTIIKANLFGSQLEEELNQLFENDKNE